MTRNAHLESFCCREPGWVTDRSPLRIRAEAGLWEGHILSVQPAKEHLHAPE